MGSSLSRQIALATAAALLVAACGSDDDDGGSASSQPASSSASSGAPGTGSPSGDVQVVKLGVLSEETGPAQELGVSLKAGVDRAVSEINAAGGFVVGDTTYEFEVISEDTRSDPAAASTAAVQLVEDDGVQFVFGTAATGGVRAALPITREHEVIHFSACGGCEAAGLMGTDDTAFFFRTFASSQAKLAAIVTALRTYAPDASTIAILDPDVNKPLTDVLAQDLRDLGYDVPDPVYFPAGTTDFSSYVTRIKGSSPDVVYGSQSDTEVQTQMGQVAQQAAAPTFLTLENSPTLATDLELPIQTLLVYTHPSLALAVAPELQAFVESGWVGDPPPQVDYASFVYDYVYMLAEAMKQAGTVSDTTSIRDALLDVSYDGIIGTLAFDENHQVVLGAQVGEVVDGETQSVLVTPEELAAVTGTDG